MNQHASFPAMLEQRASLHPSRPAVVFIDDADQLTQWSYGELWQRCRLVAGQLAAIRSPAGDDGEAPPPRALLLFPPGLDFLPALLGAQLAGWIPVPTAFPKPHRRLPRLEGIARDCQPALLLSDVKTLQSLDRNSLELADLSTIAVDHRETLGTPDDQLAAGEIRGDGTALLQYTSGSTSAPKGVVVSQHNLMANLEAIRTSFALDWADAPAGSEASDEITTVVFWLPYFHDMGLIGGVLSPLYLGARVVLISPQSFIRRPHRWLALIQRYRAVVTGAPNFAFELCSERISPQQAERLDLSSLRVTFCGAEPIRAAALRGFASRFAAAGFHADSFYPCYGMAESTLLTAGGRGPGRLRVLHVDRAALRRGRVRPVSGASEADALSLVGCGQAAGDTELVIVAPETARALPERRIGEIWIRGQSVAAGYWMRPQENRDRFAARLVRGRLGERLFGRTAHDDGGYYRTGDLGFLHHGELYVTGRIKELIIIRGRNFFPQDIEASILQSVSATVGRVVALSVEGPRGEALAVVAEVARRMSQQDHLAACRQIRAAVIEEHEIDPREVVLVRPASIPLTTSGKLQRSRSRDLLAPSCSRALYRWRRSGGGDAVPLELPRLPSRLDAQQSPEVARILGDWIVNWLVVRGNVDPQRIQVHQRFEDYGLDSLMAIELVGDLEDCCGVELTPMLASDHPTIAGLAELVAQQLCGGPASSVGSVDRDGNRLRDPVPATE